MSEVLCVPFQELFVNGVCNTESVCVFTDQLLTVVVALIDVFQDRTPLFLSSSSHVGLYLSAVIVVE